MLDVSVVSRLATILSKALGEIPAHGLDTATIIPPAAREYPALRHPCKHPVIPLRRKYLKKEEEEENIDNAPRFILYAQPLRAFSWGLHFPWLAWRAGPGTPPFPQPPPGSVWLILLEAGRRRARTPSGPADSGRPPRPFEARAPALTCLLQGPGMIPQ